MIKYGTKRMNALEIIENLLNLKQIEVKDRVEEDGKVRYVLNAKETLLAREKGDILKEKFRSWFWNDSQRYENIFVYIMINLIIQFCVNMMESI